MTTNIGLLLAAGRASRWGGTYKELLPMGHHRWLCDYALDAFRAVNVTSVIVVTRLEKITAHADHFSRYDVPFSYTLQAGDTMWSAIRSALPSLRCADRVYFAMPDTAIQATAFQAVDNRAAISFGTFETHMPERFSVIDVHAGTIRTKDTKLKGTVQRAWGVVSWSNETTRYMEHVYSGNNDVGYDEVFTDIAVTRGFQAYDIGSYADMASWSDYNDHVKGIR